LGEAFVNRVAGYHSKVSYLFLPIKAAAWHMNSTALRQARKPVSALV
jgi:hypothetical protein